MGNKLDINKTTRDAATDYADAIIDACKLAKVAPIKALTDTDEYPKLLKREMVEFSIGWFRGIADVIGVTIEEAWAELAPERAFTITFATTRSGRAA
jgi:hypothetical protein